LLDLNKGWRIKENEKPPECLEGNKIVGLIGLNRSGKTHLLSKLMNVYKPNDLMHHTKNLSFSYGKNDTVFIDSMGLDRRIKYLKETSTAGFMQQWKARDFFVQSYIINQAHILIFLLNEITPEDQKLMNVLLEKCKGAHQTIVMIHNFKDTYSIEHIENRIVNYLEPGFNLKVKEYQFNKKERANLLYYEQIFGNNRKIMHLILGRDGSEAGNHYNPTTSAILSHLVYNTEFKEKFNPLSSFFDFAKWNLRHYIELLSEKDKKDDEEFPLEKNDDKVFTNSKFRLTNFLMETFGNAIDKLKMNSQDLDYVICKEEKCLVGLFYVPHLKEGTMKISAFQTDSTHFKLKLDGKRYVVSSNGEKYDSPNTKWEKTSLEDFHVVTGFDVNCQYELEIHKMDCVYSNTMLMIRIPKIEDMLMTYSPTFIK